MGETKPLRPDSREPTICMKVFVSKFNKKIKWLLNRTSKNAKYALVNWKKEEENCNLPLQDDKRNNNGNLRGPVNHNIKNLLCRSIHPTQEKKQLCQFFKNYKQTINKSKFNQVFHLGRRYAVIQCRTIRATLTRSSIKSIGVQ